MKGDEDEGGRRRVEGRKRRGEVACRPRGFAVPVDEEDGGAAMRDR